MDSLGWNPEFVTCLEAGENYMCTFGGTSAAAPQVAGILALIRSKNPNLFGQYKTVLNNSARDGIGDQYDTTGWDQVYGYGLASAFRAQDRGVRPTAFGMTRMGGCDKIKRQVLHNLPPGVNDLPT